MNRLTKLGCILALLLLLAPGTATSQKLAPGPQILTIYSDIDDTEQPYALYLPEKYNPKKKYPLVMSLHGAGSNHRLNLKRVFGFSNVEGETDVEASRYFQNWKNVEYIVAAPFARGTMGYQGVAEKDVLDILADVRRRFSIDEDRMYLTGLSMGGGGTLWFGLSRPDLWAAIAPVCPAPPAGTDALIGNALNVPVHIHQGGADPVVRPEGTRRWVDQLKELGTQVEYTEYPGVQHDSWVPAYKDQQIFDWFSRFKRNAFPNRVRYATARYATPGAYWVRIDELTPGTTASIDASFGRTNEIEVKTAALSAFTLTPTGHVHFKPKKPVVVNIDGQTIQVAVGGILSFRREGDRWTQGAYEAPALAKRAGQEGPMTEVQASRHVYVYGTLDNPNAVVRAARRQQAEEAANWSVYRNPFMGRVMVFPRVLADVEVRPSDLASANLVLFGTAETNSRIAAIKDQLPLHLAPTDTTHGLVYAYPANGRMVLINSGLPWWKRQSGAGSIFTGGIAAFALPPNVDYLLFEGSADKVVASGRFDRSWRLPEDAAAALRPMLAGR